MIDLIGEAPLVALIGALGGLVLGLAARLGRFCTLGAIEDVLYGGSSVRLRMWGLAIGVAMIGVHALSGLGLLSLDQTLYLSRDFTPLASVVGGLVFGYGMALAGNCGYGALARAGGGDIRSFVIVLVMGLSAYIALGGPLSRLRLMLFEPAQQPEALPSFATYLGDMTSLSSNVIGMSIGAAILLATLAHRGLLKDHPALIWGLAAGVAIISGWAGTQWIADHGFEAVPVVTHTFSAPIGETMLYAMTSSGNSISFGTGSVLGVLTGAFIGSHIKGHFRWESCEDPRELRRQIGGGILMGFGAVIAVGCSIGQGLSAFSVLAYSAPLTFAAILAGAALGLRQLIEGFERI